ncbi:MAG: hypothetical protein MUP47_07750 [Phycisphaerae bacterium]|nr:hypothetical protein [Phycisphaerae bacterium]
MRTLQTLAGLWCLTCLALGAWGQEVAEPVVEPSPQPAVEPAAVSAPTTAVAMPKPESVLQHIPADALGYVVVRDVGALMGKVDAYLAEIGLAELVAPAMPTGALDSVRAAAMLGEGFNPSGGCAVVMLDPEKLGVDLLAIMGQGEEPASQPETEPVEPKLPIVILVPGLSVESVFGNYPITPGQKYTEVALRVGPMLAKQMGGYVCLSPSAEALDALAAAAPASPPAELTELLARSDITLHINMEVAAPLVDKLLAKGVASMAEGQAPPVIRSIWSTYMGFYKELCSQMTAVSIGGRFVPTGVVIEAMAGFKPDSPLGRAIATAQPAGGNLLGRVSSPSYVLAIGMATTSSEETENQQKAFAIDIVDTCLAMPPLNALAEQTKADLKALVLALSEQQAGGMQMVIGGAPRGSGLFGASAVLRCKDSAALKELLLGAVPLVETVIKTLAEEEELPFQIVTTRGVATVDGLAVDAIEFIPRAEQEEPTATTESAAPAEEAEATTDPAETEAPATEEAAAPEKPTTESAPAEAEKGPIATVMGEDKIRFYLAAVDPQTLVVTFGGAQPYLAEAVRVAKAGDGTILSDPAVAKALAVMPKSITSVGLLNVGNLFDVITHAAVTMEGPGAGPPFKITTQTPIAMGGGASGTSAYVVYYIPNDLVKEGVNIFKQMFAPSPVPTSGPSGAGDF